MLNQFGQAIGESLPGWTARARPSCLTQSGQYCCLEPLDTSRHADDLFAAYSLAPDGRDWTYMPVGPFAGLDEFRAHAERMSASEDPQHYAIIDLATGKAVGSCALMRIDPVHGVMEVGHVAYSPLLKRTRVAVEAIFLLMTRVFDQLGYRRFEWKCDHLNAPSRAAALRYGFQFEGIFRQAVVYKGRTRDTAWFSIIDGEWPAVRAGTMLWLDAGNFDQDGRQKQALGDLIAAQRE